MSKARLADYDPLDPAIIKNPFPYYPLLQRDAPVHRVEKRGFYVISRYDDVAAVLQNWQDFTTSSGPGPAFTSSPVAAVLQSDPPVHTRLRTIISKAFTPRAIKACEPLVIAYAHECMDRILAQPRADLVEEYAIPIPVVVIAELLGVPREDRRLFRAWSDDVVAAIGGRRGASGAPIAFDTYFSRVIEERRREPRDDVISKLFEPNRAGETLSVPELLAFCLSLLVAGNETTTGLIGNLFFELAKRPDDWQRLRADRSLVPSAIEESLRHDGPNQGLFRHTTRDVTLHGVTIPANSKVLVLFGAAGYDASHFNEPERFDIAREPNRHLAFGAGIHHCLGASLGRLEATVALGVALDRIESLRLVETDPPYVPIFFIRCPERIVVETKAA